MLYGNGAVFLQLINDVGHMVGVVDGDRYAHLAGADHVDTGLVRLEYLEYLTQETMGKQHAATLDLNADDLVLGGNGLYGAGLEIVVDDSAGRGGIQCVEQAHRHTGELGRLDAGGVQNLGTEVGQLGCLLEMKLADRLGVFHNAWVVVVHAVYVGPDVNLLGLDGSTDEACCIV